MIHFQKARPEDAEALTEVQVRTFDDDARQFAGQPGGGPPGYDSVDWQLRMMKRGIYYKILADDQIVGGFILFDMRRRHFNLGRIFIDPNWQNQGIGTQAIEFMEKAFPYVKKWSLDTPHWAQRNHHFYAKMGYVKVGEDSPGGMGECLYLYEKRIP
jgi:GNAT superfamily N-acetyltransferase